MNLPENAVRKGLKNPRKALRCLYGELVEEKRIYLTCRAINQKYYRYFRGPGDLDIMREDWDTLLLIDACRYDYFAEESDLPGTLDDRSAPGSMSLEFIDRTFADRQFHDTVYVTANPFAARIEPDTFHDIISLLDEYFDQDIRTVPPEELTAAVRKAHEEYPHKRIIAHYMQPHAPFLSDFGQTVSAELTWKGNQYHLSEDVELSDVRGAYRENVEVVLDELEGVIPDIPGKIVVTSDHGELLGERLFPIPIRGFEHPKSIYEEESLRVPWLEINTDMRRRIKTEPPKEREQIASRTAEKRLEQLGYL
ncbi:alkaline phosphatase family protein [Natronococcus wangiae]|uniref:hypothetical protein n=1 Tax=Natronococcus wangiae TaxID=3068275 RepID=UPI00273E5C86|nr:hypothetical protein [Natronococcus sp. AD5]